MITQRIRIQRELISLARAGAFYAVTYDPATWLPNEVTEADATAPSSVLANEVEARFAVDPRHGRDLRLRKGPWTFELLMEFPKEVTLEVFEQALSQDPPILPSAEGLDQVMLVLQKIGYIHPVQQNASSGTAVKVVLEAVVGRI